MTILTEDILHIHLGNGLYIYPDGIKTDGARLVFDEDAIVDLFDTPTVRRDTTARAISHGAFPERGYYDARTLTITGYAFAQSGRELQTLRDAVVRATDPQKEQPVTVSTRYEERTYTSMGGTLTWLRQTDTRARFKIDMYCPDPRAYGEWQEALLYSSDRERFGLDFPMDFPAVFSHTLASPPSTPMRNNGNTVAYPIYRVQADTDGFTIKDGSRTLTFSGHTDESSEVIIDTATGQVTIGGSDRSYLLTQRDWITVPPNSEIQPTVDFQAGPDDEGDMKITVSFRDTYI